VKIVFILLSVLFLAFAILQLNDPDWPVWTIAYAFSAYTAACSARNYYNPMLLMMLVCYYAITAIHSFPHVGISEWLGTEQQSASLGMNLPFIEEARESLGMTICAAINFWLMMIGFSKAKKADYNKEFSVTVSAKSQA